MATAQLVTLAPEQKQFFDDNGYLGDGRLVRRR